MSFTLSEFLRKDNELLLIKRSNIYHALNEFHAHPEMELLHVTEGRGTLLIGDKPIIVHGGELILIGCNTPHLFRFEREAFTDPIMHQGKISLPLNLLLLHFDPYLFGDTFINVPENAMIKQLLEKAHGGLLISGGLKQQALAIMDKLLAAPITDRLVMLLTLLNKLASVNHTPLTTATVSTYLNKSDETRLTKVFLLTMHNFDRRLKLKQVADCIYMAPNAFCNYFKQKTGKPFFEFLLEVRINHACKLLHETDLSVVMICYDSGFTNLSNFNRQFKSRTGKTPLAYRKAHAKPYNR